MNSVKANFIFVFLLRIDMMCFSCYIKGGKICTYIVICWNKSGNYTRHKLSYVKCLKGYRLRQLQNKPF